jgi:GAF domain-containing protein
MLDAKWGGVMVLRGRETDLYQANSSENPLEPSQHGALVRLAREHRREIEVRLLSTDSALTSLTEHSGAAVVLVPITASDEENLGSVCLLRDRGTLEKNERNLLHALASHAALSLENFRRFSQLERSKRQWVEDIDAISDYIVVHDRSFRIVRTNRSLASHLGVPPVALVGEAMSSLRQIGETGSELPCPFCRDTQQAREEYVVASPERIFLVSTSRTPGVSDDDTRTIHVLKDIANSSTAFRKACSSRRPTDGFWMSTTRWCGCLVMALATNCYALT